VVMTGGSPSLRRRRPMVTVTVLVNGSACSSQACSSRFLRAEEGRRGAEERFEDRELLDRKVKLPPVAGDRAAQRVKLNPGRAQHPAPGGRLAAREGTDARDQLGEVERLGQVVVGAQAQATDPLPGALAAVSMSTMTRSSRSVII
jgi:hypothetical protein